MQKSEALTHNVMSNRLHLWLLSTYALIPCVMLFILSFMAMVGAAIQADDFNREMTQFEELLFKSPVIPIIWFIAIVIARVFKVNEPKYMGSLRRTILWLTLALVIPASILLWFAL